MDWFTGIATYFLIWWVMLFTILPLGAGKPENPGHGHDHGAPDVPNIKRKFLLTTGVAAVVWVILEVVIEVFDLSFLEMFG